MSVREQAGKRAFGTPWGNGIRRKTLSSKLDEGFEEHTRQEIDEPLRQGQIME